jgi:predicted dehydrogenase
VYRFEGGAIGQVTVTYEAHWPEAGAIDDHFRLVGTKGMIVGDRVALDGRDGWQVLPGDESPIVTGTRGCVAAFVRSILDGVPVEITGRDAFDSLAASVAADEAAATGQPQRPAAS